MRHIHQTLADATLRQGGARGLLVEDGAAGRCGELGRLAEVWREERPQGPPLGCTKAHHEPHRALKFAPGSRRGGPVLGVG